MGWLQMAEGLVQGRHLSEQEAELLFSAVFDGGMPELEMGALLALLERRPVSTGELRGAWSALASRVCQAPLPSLQWRPVVMPAYAASRACLHLAPLLALSLQRLGIPVLVHGALSGEGGVSAAYLLRELGVMPTASLMQAQQVLAAGRTAFVPTGALSPALAQLLALRVRIGGGALARLLARLADPFAGGALQLLPVTDAGEGQRVQELLLESAATALVFESAAADAAVDAERRPVMTLFREGRLQTLFEGEAHARCAHPLPAAQDLKGTARWILGVLEGRIPMPAPIVNQIACCLYGSGYAQDLNQAKAIAAVETGSLAAA